MTPDQIRQIAEEYARTQMVDFDQGYWDEERFSDRVYNGLLDEYTESVIPIVQFLTERYCVVERSKVVGEMKGAQWLKETSEGMDDASYTKGMAYGQIYILESLFSPETFNKKEE